MSDTAKLRATELVSRSWSRMRLTTIFPIIGQLQGYRTEWLINDTVAGLAIAAVALPIGMAYPETS